MGWHSGFETWAPSKMLLSLLPTMILISEEDARIHISEKSCRIDTVCERWFTYSQSKSVQLDIFPLLWQEVELWKTLPTCNQVQFFAWLLAQPWRFFHDSWICMSTCCGVFFVYVVQKIYGQPSVRGAHLYIYARVPVYLWTSARHLNFWPSTRKKNPALVCLSIRLTVHNKTWTTLNQMTTNPTDLQLWSAVWLIGLNFAHADNTKQLSLACCSTRIFDLLAPRCRRIWFRQVCPRAGCDWCHQHHERQNGA